jgi:DNA-3-methyladenine glycosylase
MTPLGKEFFMRDPVTCARELVGAIFEWDGCTGRIIETEAYAAEGDPACHTFSRPSARRFVEIHDAGTAYVYLNYGVHWLFNLLVKGPEGAGFVLFRALEPIAGLQKMRKRRPGRPDLKLCAGPGCLTQALGIDETAHGLNFLSSSNRRICPGRSAAVVADGRIGISRARELPWRFSEQDHLGVSRPLRQRIP